MEKRKIQHTGGSSFSMTLPKKWIESHKLKKHDFVVSLERGDSLIVIPHYLVESQTKGKIYLDNLRDTFLKRELIAHYILGFDELEVLGSPIKKEKRLIIRRIVEALAGFEIIEDSANQIVIRNILNIEKLSFRESASRMFLMTYSMFQDAITSTCENNKKLAQDIIERDYEINKLYFLILRQNRYSFQDKIYDEKLTIPPIRAIYQEGIAVQLERIADHAVKIAKIIAENNLSLSKNLTIALQETAEKILPLLIEAEHFVKNIDKKGAHEVLDQADKIKKIINNFSLKVAKQKSPRASILSDSIDRLYGYISNMAELTIDQAIVEKAIQ